MNRYNLECLYCGKVWNLEWQPKHPKCAVCNDKNIKIKREHSKGNYFGYEETSPNKEEYGSYLDVLKYITSRNWGE